MAFGLALISFAFFPPFVGVAAFVCALSGLLQASSQGYAMAVLALSILCPVSGTVLFGLTGVLHL